MSDPDIDENGAALAAALEELFRQYPLPTLDKPLAAEWRESALGLARDGFVRDAIIFAMGTGVPNDLLFALRGLLDE